MAYQKRKQYVPKRNVPAKRSRSTGRRLQGVSNTDLNQYLTNAVVVGGGTAIADRIQAFGNSYSTDGLSAQLRSNMRTGSRTKTVKRNSKKSTETDGAIELAMTKMRYGSYVATPSRGLLGASVQSTWLRAGNANPYANSASASTLPGYFGLTNYNASGTGDQYTPMHLWDVTSWFNNQAGVAVLSTPGYSMRLVGTVPTFSILNGCSWQIENTGATPASTGASPNQSDMLKYIQAKLMLYGASDRPTRFNLMLMSLKQDYLHPDMIISAGAVANSSTDYINQRSLFWQSVVKEYCFNPVMIGQDKSLKQNMTVLQEKDIIVQPKLSTEASGFSGHSHQVNWDMNLNRKQNYAWNEGTIASIGVASNNVPVVINDMSCTVAPSRRLYLMLRATSGYETVVSSNPKVHPSYDCVLRGLHQMLA